MGIIDTHTHIYGDEFAADRDEIIERARAAGVEQVILPNVDVHSLEQIHHLHNEYPHFCQMTIGLHPTDVKDDFEEQLELLQANIGHHPYVAIGEAGLDFHWDRTYAPQQKIAFARQIEWALAYDLPLIIHTRDSLNDTLDVLQSYRNDRLRGIFHCFTGNQTEAEAIFATGDFKLGIGGVLTFKNSNLATTLTHVPLDRIVLETDAPYLAPVPYRGKRNEPALLVHVIRRLAEIYSCTENQIIATTTATARTIFNISAPKQA